MMTRQILNISYFLAAAAAMVLAFGIANAANAGRHVKPSIAIDGPVVTLGDLFAHEPGAAWAGVRVADAPAPGEAGRIRTMDVATAARRAGLAWDHATAPHTIAVSRNSHTLSPEALESLLKAALPASVSGKGWEIQLNNRGAVIHLPIGFSARDIEVQRLYYDDRSQSFNASLAIPDGKGRRNEETVTGRLEEMAYIPVLNTSMSDGEVIRKRDIAWSKIPARKVNRNVVTSTDDLIGMAARRSLRAGTILRPNDIETPVMIEKGTLVTMAVTTDAMKLTATGRALEDGSRGDVIRLVNVSTHTTIEGVVVSPRQVTIQSAARVAALR